MSPELFDPGKFNLRDDRPTKHSDCYALGMVIYEVLSGRSPFYQYPMTAAVVRILEGERPGIPQGVEGVWFKDDVRRIMECCWRPIPRDRPGIRDVLQCLETISRTWTPPSPQTLVCLPTTDPPTHNPDSSGEESTDESEVSPSSQVGSSQPSRKLSPTGDPNENNI